MSAWSKQAVPLIFVDVTFGAIMRYNSDRAAVRKLDVRIQRWLEGCWEALRNAKHKPEDDKAMKRAISSSERIQSALQKEWTSGVQTQSEITVALCIIVDDTLKSMPQKHPGRKAWDHLLKALYAAWRITDPKETDTHGYERGKRIAARVLEAAQ